MSGVSPNDSTSRFIGAKYSSYADCVRSWQSTGNAGDGGCVWNETSPPTTGIEAFTKWATDALSGITDTVGKISTALSGITSRLQALEDLLKDFWQKLEAWLVERIVEILLKGLNAGAKEYNQLQRKT